MRRMVPRITFKRHDRASTKGIARFLRSTFGVGGRGSSPSPSVRGTLSWRACASPRGAMKAERMRK